MSDHDIRRASSEDIEEMHRRGELFHDPNAPEGPPEDEEFPPDFWDKAELWEPRKTRSVHLRLDADVFDFFHEQAQGKGHLTRMQRVLKAYADSQRSRKAG